MPLRIRRCGEWTSSSEVENGIITISSKDCFPPQRMHGSFNDTDKWSGDRLQERRLPLLEYSAQDPGKH